MRGNMRAVVFVWCFALVRCGYSDVDHSLYYCKDHEPQRQVDVEQLMGMWFGVEIIHQKRNNVHEVIYDEACPVFHITEDTDPHISTTTEYTSDYVYPRNFRERYNRRKEEDSYIYSTQGTTYTDGFKIYTTNDDNYRRYNSDVVYYGGRRNFQDETKWLRILAIDKGDETEYSVRYNISRAGFWISTGPQNGSSLDEKFKRFAGLIQVLKAVGNHMVLVFCHRVPQQELFTVILSRVQNLSQHEIHGVHSLLNRKGLSTTSIVKVCTANDATVFTFSAVAVYFLALTTCLISGNFW